MLQRSREIKRYFVPDLAAWDQKQLQGSFSRWVFVAESPHVSEVEPAQKNQRRPLCGVAGRQWWGLVTELLEGNSNPDVSLLHLLTVCSRHRLTVMNAVQYPLDSKVSRLFPDADPIKNLKFSKNPGDYFYKKKKNTSVLKNALNSLKQRLLHPSIARASIIPLGNDAEWFVKQALENIPRLDDLKGKIPHPSAWWRRGGLFGQIARERLSEIFSAP